MQMSESFDVVLTRLTTQTLTMKIAANTQDEAKQKAWEALLVDEHENRLPWRQSGTAGDISLEATRAAS